jgi:hypothetical protein
MSSTPLKRVKRVAKVVVLVAVRRLAAAPQSNPEFKRQGVPSSPQHPQGVAGFLFCTALSDETRHPDPAKFCHRSSKANQAIKVN